MTIYKPRVEEISTDPQCLLDMAHHYKIEPPKGPTSRGRCKNCGYEKDFYNSARDHLWEDGMVYKS